MKPSNEALMERIRKYMIRRGVLIPNESKVVCSMGEIEVELQIPLWKQQLLNRTYRTKFSDLDLSRGDWTLDLKVSKHIPATPESQDQLSAKGD